MYFRIYYCVLLVIIFFFTMLEIVGTVDKSMFSDKYNTHTAHLKTYTIMYTITALLLALQTITQ